VIGAPGMLRACSTDNSKRGLHRSEVRSAEHAGIAVAPAVSAEAVVERALRLLDDSAALLRSRKAQEALPALFRRLGLRVGLHFVTVTKGSCRRVQRLAGGEIVLGNRAWATERGNPLSPHPTAAKNTMDRSGIGDQTPMWASAAPAGQSENCISSTKGSRGDNPAGEPCQDKIEACAAALMEARGPHIEAITQLTRGG